MTTVSVIMPTYNRAAFIRDAIDSVLGQTYPHFELIIIDDGSTDGTSKIVAPYLTDERIRYVRQENAGAASARNHGIALGRGDMVAFIDSDDIWDREKLRIQTAVMDALPEVGIVCSDFSALRGSRILETSHIRSFFSVLDEYALTYDDVFSRLLDLPVEGLDKDDAVYWGSIFSTMLFGNIILTSTCLCRAVVFNTTGVFDTSLETLEDYDLFLKITKVFPVALISKPLILYRYSENQLSGEKYFDKVCANLIKIFIKFISTIDDEQFLRDNRKKIRNRLGHYYAQQGYFHFSREELRESAQCYRQSIRNNLSDYKSYVYLFFSLMPVGISRFIRKLK